MRIWSDWTGEERELFMTFHSGRYRLLFLDSADPARLWRWQMFAFLKAKIDVTLYQRPLTQEEIQECQQILNIEKAPKNEA